MREGSIKDRYLERLIKSILKFDGLELSGVEGLLPTIIW